MATRRALAIEDGFIARSTVATTKNRKSIDLDIAFKPKPITGDVYKKTEAAAVKQSVRNILLTSFNEKPFAPVFGANLNSYLFELAEPDIEYRIATEVQNALEAYEPRVDKFSLKTKVKAQPDANALDVTVVFNIINTGEEVTLTTSLNRLR